MSSTNSENFQAVLMRVHNSRVKTWFADISDASLVERKPAPGEPNLSRLLLKQSCTIKDSDSHLIAIQKILMFEMTIGHFKSGLSRVVGYPAEVYEETHVWYHPQVKLHFRQDAGAVPKDEVPIEAEISFRLMTETGETYTEAKAKVLAKKVRDTLLVANGYTFDKGKFLCRYTDKQHGYNFQIYALSKAEGIQVVKKLLSIQDHFYDDDLFNCTEPGKSSVNTRAATQRIYGQNRKKRRWRPTGKVRFQYATLSVWGLDKSIYLCDRTGTFIEAFYNK